MRRAPFEFLPVPEGEREVAEQAWKLRREREDLLDHGVKVLAVKESSIWARGAVSAE